MQVIAASSGPVAVTGAAGYFGSCIVRNLVSPGCAVRTCVRDPRNLANTVHLRMMNVTEPVTVTLHACDRR